MAITPEDISGSVIRESVKRFTGLHAQFQEARKKIIQGRGHEAESSERKVKANLRQKEMATVEAEEAPLLQVLPGLGQEAFIGKRNNILSGEFLEIGILAARSVCKITRGIETGTGFMVGEGILITNHHVIQTANQSKSAIFEFLLDDNTIGKPSIPKHYIADPDRFFFSNHELDLCFVALKEVDGTPPVSSLGWLPLLPDEGKILMGDPVNIIQHPRGQHKRLVVHDSVFVLVDNDSDANAFCWYTGDTDKGSSGSPVLNSRWEVVALHHMAVPATDRNGNVLDVNGKTIAASRFENDPDTRIQWVANEGVRVSRIVAKLEAADLSADHAAVRKSLLELWRHPLATILARKASLAGMEAE